MAIELTDKQKGIASMLENALAEQRVEIDSALTDDEGNPIIAAKKKITKKAVKALVFQLFPDEAENQEEEQNE